MAEKLKLLNPVIRTTLARREEIEAATYGKSEHPAMLALLAFGTNTGHTDTAMALAMARRGPGDYSPEFLLWLYLQMQQYNALVLAVMREKVSAFIARNSIRVSKHVSHVATADGVALVWSRSQRNDRIKPIDQRAKDLGVRKATFATLRNFVEHALRVSINGCLDRFFHACGYRHIPGEFYAFLTHRALRTLQDIAHVLPNKHELLLDYEANRERIEELGVSSFTRQGAQIFADDVSQLDAMLRELQSDAAIEHKPEDDK